jgi:hypothetical protein
MSKWKLIGPVVVAGVVVVVVPPGMLVVVVPPGIVVVVVPPGIVVVVVTGAVVVVVDGVPPAQFMWQSRQLPVMLGECRSTKLQAPGFSWGWHTTHLSAVTLPGPGVPAWHCEQLVCPGRLCRRWSLVELNDVGWHTTQLLI